MCNKPCVILVQTKNEELKATTQGVESLNQDNGNERCFNDNSSQVIWHNKKVEVTSLAIKHDHIAHAYARVSQQKE